MERKFMNKLAVILCLSFTCMVGIRIGVYLESKRSKKEVEKLRYHNPSFEDVIRIMIESKVYHISYPRGTNIISLRITHE